jgi:putative CocE/NonD family hydrolase
MSDSFIIDHGVPIEMRDGVKLMADIYRPGGNDKYPAILLRTPYHSSEVFSFSYVEPLPTLISGYALVLAYVRGRYGSEGKYELTSSQQVEGADCYDTVEWRASQPWCDGNIGMAGESALGTIQWRTARENPPHLKAIAPSLTVAPGETGPEASDYPVYLNIASAFTMIIARDILNKLERSGTDTSEMRRWIKSVEEDPSIVYNYLPLKNVPQFNIPGIIDIWHTLLRIPSSKEQPASPEPFPYHKINIPCLSIASWYDPWSRGTFRTFLNMRTMSGNGARQRQHIFAGPWCHHRPVRVLGDIDFGPLADDVGSKAWGYQLAFFDKYLKRKDITLPLVRYFRMGSNSWHNADDWPLPRTTWQRFFLHSNGGANSASGDGLLTRKEPQSEPPDTYVYDPNHPVPTTGGRGAEAENGFVTGPIDQIHIERRHDVLCYRTPELDQNTEITGPIELHLFPSSSCRDTDFSTKLVDVYPDGRAYNITDGIVRAQYRNSFTKPEPLKPAEIVELIIRLGITSQLFRRGHRIRLDITSSNFPAFDRNMNTGNPIGIGAEGIPALQTVYHQSGYASYIELPFIPA